MTIQKIRMNRIRQGHLDVIEGFDVDVYVKGGSFIIEVPFGNKASPKSMLERMLRAEKDRV